MRTLRTPYIPNSITRTFEGTTVTPDPVPPGQDGRSYRLVVSPSILQRAADGTLSVSSVTLSAFSAVGAEAPTAYSGRFTIETSVDGSAYTAAYASSSDESTATLGSFPPGMRAIRARLYLAGGTTALLDEEIVPVVADGTGAPGQDSTSYWTYAMPSVIAKKSSGVQLPTTLTAYAYSATGAGSPTPYAGRFVIATLTGSTWTDRYTSATDETTCTWTVVSNIVTVRVRLYLAGGTTTLLDEQQVPVVSDGLDGVTVGFTNASHTVPADSAGNVTSYAGSGALVQVFEGSTLLSYVASSPAAGQFSIGTATVEPAASITVGAITGSAQTATIANHSGMSASVSVCTITYPISARRANGDLVTVSVKQTITKALAGSDGQNGTDGAPGTPGTPGTDAIAAQLSRDSVALAADSYGALTGNPPYASTEMRVYVGNVDDTATWTFSASPASEAITVTYTLAANVLTVTGMATAINGHDITITASKAGFPNLTKRFTIVKARSGASGSPATTYRVICSPSAVQRTVAGVYSPTSITVNAYSSTGTSSFIAYGGRFVIATSDGTTWTDRYTSAANESSRVYSLPAGVTAVRARLYLAGGTATLLDEQTVPVVSDGPTGPDGLAAITTVMPNSSHTVPSDYYGNVTNYGGSGTTIQVYEGSTALAFNGGSVTAASQFAIGTPIASPVGAITVGARSGVGTTTATVAQHSAMTQDVATITYPITVRRANGTDVSLSLIQTLTKSRNGANGTNGLNGARGSMTFYVDITPYTTWADAGRPGNDAESAVAGWGGPKTGDTMTQYNSSAGVAITRYYNGTNWVSPGTVIDGTLMATGTIYAPAMASDQMRTSNFVGRCPYDDANLVANANGSFTCPTHGAQHPAYAVQGGILRRNSSLGATDVSAMFDPRGFKIGKTLISNAWFGNTRIIAIPFAYVDSAGTVQHSPGYNLLQFNEVVGTGSVATGSMTVVIGYAYLRGARYATLIGSSARTDYFYGLRPSAATPVSNDGTSLFLNLQLYSGTSATVGWAAAGYPRFDLTIAIYYGDLNWW